MALFCVAHVLLARPGLFAAEPAVTLEYKVKAGYLFNFGKFVEWPVSAFAAADSPFVIAIMDGGGDAKSFPTAARARFRRLSHPPFSD